jgi:hypothetical protein
MQSYMKRESEVVDLEYAVLADGNAVAQKIDQTLPTPVRWA